MNIAKKSLEELIDTEISRLRDEIRRELSVTGGRTFEMLDQRVSDLKAAIAAAPKLDALIAEAKFLAVVDASIASDFDGGVELRFFGQNDGVRMHDPQNSFPFNQKRRKYRFVVAAIALDEKAGES